MHLRPFVIAAAVFAVADPASAHTKVVASTPADAATTSNVKTVTLTFNEAFVPKLSGLEIVMTDMPGMTGTHAAMKMTGVKVTSSPDHVTLVATLAAPLPRGSYDVNWHAVGDDTHRVTGKVRFTVK